MNWKVALRFLFGLSTFLLLFYYFNPKEIIEVLKQTNWFFVALTVVLCIGVMGLRAWRWRGVLQDLDMTAKFSTLFGITMESNYFNTFLPGSLGGDLYRVYGLAKESETKLRPLATVVIERLTGLLALVVVCLAALTVYRKVLPQETAILAVLCFLIAAALLVGFFYITLVEKIWGLLLTILPDSIKKNCPTQRSPPSLPWCASCERGAGFISARFATGSCFNPLSC